MIGTIKNRTPDIHPSTYVAPNATVLGDVTVRKGAGVWFGAVIRGDANSISIGDHSNIQDLCVLHVDENNSLSIGNDVTIGHRALLHGCTIGNEVLIGMGATIMNGAKIGNNCIVGAGALVTERTEIPDGSLVIGFPARIKRPLTDEEVESIRNSAVHYTETAALYMESKL